MSCLAMVCSCLTLVGYGSLSKTLVKQRTSDRGTKGFKCIMFGYFHADRLCGLVVRVLGYRSGGPGSIPGTTREKKVVSLERGPLSLVSTTEELLDRKIAAPV
jgi:hypothetical protein